MVSVGLATLAMLIIGAGVVAVPLYRAPLAFHLIAIGSVGLTFAGAFGLYLDRAHRRLSAGFFAAGAAVLLFAMPYALQVASTTRVTWMFFIPAALGIAAALVLALRLRPRLH
jgi:hypothetical protein